jgi:hypothetical protein
MLRTGIMAYVTTYDFDIFISYAHVDNSRLPDQSSGWVDHFHKALQITLNRRAGKSQKIKIWRDNKLDGNQVFDQTISEKIKNSAVFLALMSNGYLASDYCRKELNQFYAYFKNHASGIHVGDRSRIFSLLLTNISHENFPEGIAGTSSFAFHDALCDDEMGMGDPIDPCEKLFRNKLKLFANEIFRCLKQMQAPNEATIEKPQTDAFTLPEPDTDYPVFFADVSDALRLPKERVINDLQAQGVYVIDETVPPPYDIDSHDQKCSALATSAKVSVHLFDQYAGREIVKKQTFGMKQLEICLEKSASQLIWMPKSLDINAIEDKNYQGFMKTLPAPDHKIEVIQGNRNDIVTGVVNKISKMKQALNQPASDTQAAVLLDIHEKDNICAFELGNYMSLLNIKFLMTPAHEDPSKNYDKIAEYLQSVNALMLVCGNVENDTTVSRIMIMMKMILETKAAIKKQAIFLVPPKKPDEIQDLKQRIPPFLDIQLLDNSDKPHPKPEVLTPFFECIGCGGVS